MARSDVDLISFFHRHLVPIIISLKKDQEIQETVLTAFLMSVMDKWYLITAGHSISKIEKLTNQHGYEISKCLLVDYLGTGTKHHQPIPFVYEQANPTCISDERDFDYGFLEVSPHYRNLLEINNVIPLDEEVWKKRPKKIDFYLMLGIPGETVKVNPNNIEFTPTLFSINFLPNQPKGFSETVIPQFYGEIILDDRIRSIEGVSGGPVLGFYENEKGEMRYWVVALQSAWLPKSHIISACPTHILGDVIEKEYI